MSTTVNQEVKRLKVEINGNTLELTVADITKQNTDAIVNAANGTLMGGGGVDGAIHQAAGSKLVQACKTIREQKLHGERLSTGEAVITNGFQLPAAYVIHTVGPVWNESNASTLDQRLMNCYINSLQLASNYDLSSISFPSISTGIYRYPLDRAAQIAIRSIGQYLQSHRFGEATMTLSSKDDYYVYKTELDKIINPT